MIQVEIGKTYYFEPYNFKGFKAKVTSINDVKIYLDNDEKIEYSDLRMAVEIYPIITEELTFEDVKKIANENGYKLRKCKYFFKLTPLTESKEIIKFKTLEKIINYFSPF